jgi:hypothetical protein
MWNVCMEDKAWLAQRGVDSVVEGQIVYTADDNNLTVNNQCPRFTQDVLAILVLVPDRTLDDDCLCTCGSRHSNANIDGAQHQGKNDQTRHLQISMRSTTSNTLCAQAM